MLATEAVKRGDLPRAARCYLQTFGLRSRTNERWGTVVDLLGTAEIVAAVGHNAEAAQLLATATTWAKTLGFAVQGYMVDLLGRTLALLHARLGPDALAAAWERGSHIDVDDAVAAAQALLAPLAARPVGRHGASRRGRGRSEPRQSAGAPRLVFRVGTRLDVALGVDVCTDQP